MDIISSLCVLVGFWNVIYTTMMEFLCLQVLDDLVSDYESSSYGPGKPKKLANFLKHWFVPRLFVFFKISSAAKLMQRVDEHQS